MEVESVQQHPLHEDVMSNTNLGPTTMDASMDIDMDIDLGPLPEAEPVELESATESFAAQDGAGDPLNAEAQFEKVHVRGVDELTTDDIKQFATEHFPLEVPSRVEWIDDTSANIVYSSTEVGLQALAALTQLGEEDVSSLPVLRLRSAKALSTHPDSVLQVRAAVKTDRKKPRAHEASRFYLMHPEHDPREKLRRELAGRRRHGVADTSDGEYTRRRFDDQEHRRRRNRDGEGIINVDMYDDKDASAMDVSDSEGGRQSRRQRGRGELFPEDERASGRLRNRSASPGRDTLEDGQKLQSSRSRPDSRRRFRERSPASRRRNGGRDLFAASASGTESDTNTRELFPNRTAASYLKKELFPSKASNHRRSDAVDAADESADSLARRISMPLVDIAADQGPSRRKKNVELFPNSSSKGGVNIRGTAAPDEGLSIRGAADGLSIKGKGASVRELFPSKFSGTNAGKELFSDKLEGRGGRRRRAEDMFS